MLTLFSLFYITAGNSHAWGFSVVIDNHPYIATDTSVCRSGWATIKGKEYPVARLHNVCLLDYDFKRDMASRHAAVVVFGLHHGKKLPSKVTGLVGNITKSHLSTLRFSKIYEYDYIDYVCYTRRQKLFMNQISDAEGEVSLCSGDVTEQSVMWQEYLPMPINDFYEFPEFNSKLPGMPVVNSKHELIGIATSHHTVVALQLF